MIAKTVKSIGLSKALIEKVIATTLKAIKREGSTLSVTFIGDKRMRTLNRKYRSIDRTTDVLAFAMQEGHTFDTIDLGDVFISMDQINRQARELDIPYKEELCRMLIHGILHLCGYDHIKKADYNVMIPLQEKILKSLTTQYLKPNT